MGHKSLHTIFYPLVYDNKYISPTRVDSCEFIEEIAYLPQFMDLFNSGKISLYNLEQLKNCDGSIINTSESKLTLNLTEKTYELDINYVKVYCLVEYKVIIVAINVVNTHYDNFIDLSMHLDKNTSYSLHDKFESIMINGNYLSKRHTSKVNTSNLLNSFFFDDKLVNPRLVLGRKNYHMFSIVDDSLSELCKDISQDINYEIYKIATCEHVNASVGTKTYERFLDTVYDKWSGTGSLYIINETNLLQILPHNGLDHSYTFMKTYEKLVILSLFQKCMFLEFQTIAQKRNNIKSFKNFINNYYYLEISPERQVDSIYQMLQKELKNLDYYEILTSEIEIYSAAISHRAMFYITVAYTIFALISVILMIWGRQ